MVENYVKGAEKPEGAPMCPDHEGERQHFFCVTCDIMVCHNCLVLKHPHPQHEIKELKEVKKAEEEKRRDLDEMKVKLKAAKQRAEKDVKSRVQQIMNKAEAQGEEMIKHIQTTYQQCVGTLQEEQNQLTKDRKNWLQSRPSTTRNVSGHMKQHKSIIGRIDSLSITHDIPALDITNIYFKPGSLNSSWFGEVVTPSSRERKLTFVTEFGFFKRATDVAVTQAGLLAVADSLDKTLVRVYRNVNDKYNYLFRLKTSQPFSVAVTSEDKFLVAEKGVVKVFSPSGKYEKSWPRTVGVEKITTTPDGMIVIGKYETGVISVHQSNGELISTHQTDCERVNSIASNGKQIAFTTWEPGNVCVIDFVTGHTLWTLDMVRPRGICYEQKFNTLLVAGGSLFREKHVIKQYCSTTGRLIARLASGLCSPRAMTVTQDNKLVVADDITVKIYSIQ